MASASPPSLQVWTPNLSDPTFLRSWTPPPGTSASVLAWAPGPHLAAAFTGQITLLNDATGQVLQTFPAQIQGEVTTLAWYPNGTRLAWAGDQKEGIILRLLEANTTSRTLQVVPSKGRQCAAWPGLRMASGWLVAASTSS